MPPLDYIHALRLEEAKQILETEDLPIEAVALFSSSAAESRDTVTSIHSVRHCNPLKKQPA